MGELTAADELAHADVAVEAWWWWAWDAAGTTGVFVGLELHGERFDYWAGVVRPGQPYLYLGELRGTGRRAGLELKPPELWADHVCDSPWRQWSVANEGYGVLLEPAEEAWGRAYGERVPLAVDLEWSAAGPPVVLPAGRTGPPDGARGYAQDGSADVVVELLGGPLHLDGRARRVHVWGAPYVPADLAAPTQCPVAPYRRSDGRRVQQVLTPGGYLGRTVSE